MRFLADATGGLFVEAKDAQQLNSALQDMRRAAVPPKALKLGTASLTVPARVVAGSRFEVQWTGPKTPSDSDPTRAV